MKLTKATVRTAARPLKDQVFFRDDECTGFALRVLYTGAKTFVWEGRIKGRNRRITIGQYPDISVAAARAKAEEIRGAVAKGEDPADERRAERLELTFGDLAARYIEMHAKPYRKGWARMERRLKVHFASWNSRRLSDITPEAVVGAHIRIAEARGKVEANRAVELLRAAFNFGKKTLKWKGENPAENIEKFPEQPRERRLSAGEMVRVNAALADEENVYWRAYFPLVLMLGTRRGEMLSLRWENVNLAEREVRFPTTKEDRTLLLPLPPVAVRILHALPRRDGCPWVFPGDGKTGHLVEPKAAWQRIRTAAGVPDVTIHDLRRTLGSWLKTAGYDLATIGRVLNHADSSSTAIYARLDVEGIRPMLAANARLMLGAPRQKRKPAKQAASA